MSRVGREERQTRAFGDHQDVKGKKGKRSILLTLKQCDRRGVLLPKGPCENRKKDDLWRVERKEDPGGDPEGASTDCLLDCY